MIDWAQVVGFDWDEGNSRKNVDKHDVGQSEVEQVFFNQPILILADLRHSQEEVRYHALGLSDDACLLHITFTLRNGRKLIRIISARDMHRKERFFMSKAKKIPKFKTETEERVFWESHDSSEYIDWTKAQPASFPNLKPSTKTISLRLPEALLDRIKIEANKRDMPYQSLIKAWLADDVEESRRS